MELAHPLRAGIARQYKGTRSHLHNHADQGRARQRYVLLLLGGFANERVSHYCALVRQHLHSH